MNKIFNVPEIKEIRKAYEAAMKKMYKTQAAYTKTCDKANCINCQIALDDMELPLAKRYRRCGKCKDVPRILADLNVYLNASAEVDKIQAEYAKRVFNLLKVLKPMLLVRAKKEKITWEKAFPNSFSQLPATLYSSLVALVEEDGGRYRVL